MRRILAVVMGTLFIGSAAFTASPAVTATVTTTGDSVVYNYRLTNTTTVDIWGFSVFMPMGASRAIISNTTSQDGWSTIIRKAGMDMINWRYATPKPSGPKITPGASADFSFTTSLGTATTYSYVLPGDSNNWGWWEGGSGGIGDSILPVPIPEPSSLVALCGGLAPLLALRRRRGK